MSDISHLLNTIHHDDCLEFIKRLPPKCVDLVFTDPPYFDGPQKEKYYGSYVSKTGVARKKYVNLDDSWDVPTNEWYEEVLRISKHQIIFGINYFEFSNRVCGRLVWIKNNYFSSFSKCELASCSFINSVQQYEYTWNGFLQGKIGDIKLREKRIHKTQKPLPLIEEILRDYAKKGDVILDCYSGSATTAIACRNLGLDYICIEKDKKMVELSQKRVDEHIPEIKLFSFNSKSQEQIDMFQKAVG